MDIKKNKDLAGLSEKKKESKNPRQHKFWIGGYITCAVVCILFYFLLTNKFFGLANKDYIFLRKLSLGAFFSFLVLTAGRLLELFTVKGYHSKIIRYNLVKAIRLLTVIFIGIIIITFLFKNWYTAAVSLGIISLILGFALQVPISSFIAWLYIIFRIPYRVGDRIEINQFTGRCRGDRLFRYYVMGVWRKLFNQRLTQWKIIRFPNSIVLQSAVFNYSWPKSPYMWNEIPFHIAYGAR